MQRPSLGALEQSCQAMLTSQPAARLSQSAMNDKRRDAFAAGGISVPSGCAGSSVPSSSSERPDTVQGTPPRHGSCPLCGPWATMRRRGQDSRWMSSASNRTFVRHIQTFAYKDTYKRSFVRHIQTFVCQTHTNVRLSDTYKRSFVRHIQTFVCQTHTKA
jgi:hypothetical protein